VQRTQSCAGVRDVPEHLLFFSAAAGGIKEVAEELQIIALNFYAYLKNKERELLL
jgi:hypothetical protein